MNNITIEWTPDDKSLIAAMQKHIALLNKEVAGLKDLSGTGKSAMGTLTGAYRDAGKELQRLGRVAETSFKQPISAIDAHLARMKELRALYRMGKIDAEQFQRASNASLKQRYADDGTKERLKQRRREIEDLAERERAVAAKSLAEQKAASMSLRLQKLSALHELEQTERSAAAKLDAERKAAAASLRLQKLTALNEQDQVERSAAAKSLAEQKAAAAAFRLQKLTALHEQSQAEKTADEKLQADKKAAAASLRLQKLTALHEQDQMERSVAAKSLAEQKAAVASLRLQKLTALHEERQKNKEAADAVRRGLMSEQQMHRQNFRERMRHIHDLRRAGALSQAEYRAAVKQAHGEWKAISQLDMAAAWRNVPPMITQALTATAALTAAIRIARSEWETMLRRQSEARDSHMTYAEARDQAVKGLDETMTGEQFDQWAMETSKKTGQSPAFLARAATGVLGAKGKRTAASALAGMAETVPLERYRVDELKDVTSAVLQQQTVDQDATFRQVLGQQLAAKIASRVESSGSFAQYMTFGALGASAYGDSSKDWYTIGSFLANQAGDPSGQTSGTGAVDWQVDLDRLHKQMLGPDGKGAGLGRNTIERARAIAFDPKFRAVKDTLLGSNRTAMQEELGVSGGRMTARARNFGAIMKIYQGDKTAWEELEGVGKLVPELGPGSAAFVDKQIKDLDGPHQRLAVQDQTNKSTAERLKLANTPEARTAAARQGLMENLRAAGVGWTQQTGAALDFDVGTWWTNQQDPELIQARLERSAASSLGMKASEAGYGTDLARRYMDAAKALTDSADKLTAAVEAMNQAQGVNVNVNLPGEGAKPAEPPAAGLQGGRPFR